MFVAYFTPRHQYAGKCTSLTWHVHQSQVWYIGRVYSELDWLRRHCSALSFEVSICLCFDLIPDCLCNSNDSFNFPMLLS